MSLSVESVLRDILARQGTSLLDDRRRCEAHIRDTQLSREKIAGVLAALKSGMPAQFLQFQTSGLTTVAISNYVARLSEESGLNEDLARRSLEAWAYALRVDVPDRQQIPLPSREAQPTRAESRGARDDNSKRDEAPKNDAAPRPRDDAAPSAAGARGGPWHVWVLLVLGLVLVGGHGYRNLAMSLTTYAIGSLCVLAGALAARHAGWIKWPTVALCALVVLLATVGVPSIGAVLAPPIIVATLLSLIAAVGLLLWRPGDLPGATDRTDRASIAVLLAALWSICRFGLAVSGVLATAGAAYLFHPRLLWLWLIFPVSLALAWLAWSVLAGRWTSLPRITVMLLLGASALLGIADLIALRSSDPSGQLPALLYMLPIVGVVADVGIAIPLALGWSRGPSETRAKETAIAQLPMSDNAKSILRDILVRHGHVLLDDHRRFEACLRDTRLPKKETAGLLAALKSGTPARFLQHQTSGLTAVAVSNYAKRLSDETGLDVDLARSSLQAWAYALQIDVSQPSYDGGQHKTKEEDLEQDRKKQDDAVPPPHVGLRDGRWLVWLFAVQGVLLVAGQSDRFFAVTLATYATGSLCILVGAMVLRRAGWIRWPALALCAAIVVLAIAGAQSPDDVLIPTIVAAAVLSLPAVAGLLLWKAGTPQGDRWTRKQTIAAVVLCAALWNICTFALLQDGVFTGLSIGLISHPRYVWHWLSLPFNLALVWLTWSTLTKAGTRLAPIVGVGLLGVCTILTVAALVTAQNYGGLNYVPPFVPEAIAIVANLGAAIFLIVGRAPDNERRLQEAPRA